MTPLIAFENAMTIIDSIGFSRKTERVSLRQAHKRVLQEGLYIHHAVPSFDRAAMDGYACRWDDINNTLHIIEEIPAGQTPQKAITEGTCARIMTGAMVPAGADLVAEQEICSASEDVISFNEKPRKSNIQKKGEDMRAGQLLLKKGTYLQPWHIAMIATAGIAEVEVSKKPNVLVIATGSELTEPGEKATAAGIYNSNAYQMLAQLEAMGISAEYAGIMKDDRTHVENMLASTDKYDLVLMSGGVSVGDYDFIPDSLEKLNYKIHFHGLQVKPGKRTLLAQKSNSFVIGLPGNPVSSLLQFEELVRPFLLRMIGAADQRELILLESEEQLLTKPAKRMVMLPVIVKGGNVKKIRYNGSAHIHAFVDANAIAIIPEGTQKIEKGDKIHVRFIS